MEERTPRQQSPNNNTTFKHLSARHSFQAIPFEKEDDQVYAQSTLTNTFKNINTAIRYSPDRQLLKQIKSFDLSSDQKVKIIADEYYNHSIFQKTHSFLDDIKRVIVFWEEKLRIKRKQTIQQTASLIKHQWAQIQQHLIKLVSRWCLSCEKYEIGSFLQRSEIVMNGALIQLLSRLQTKRQQIEQHISHMATLTKQDQSLRGEELTSHMKYVKKYYKDIWNKDYEFQVESLEKQCASKLNKSYIYTKIQPKSAKTMQQQLKSNIESLFQDYFHVIQEFKGAAQQKQPEPSSSNHRDIQDQSRTQSFQRKNNNSSRNNIREQNYENQQQDLNSAAITKRIRQIQQQRLQRDKQWIILVQGLDS